MVIDCSIGGVGMGIKRAKGVGVGVVGWLGRRVAGLSYLPALHRESQSPSDDITGSKIKYGKKNNIFI